MKKDQVSRGVDRKGGVLGQRGNLEIRAVTEGTVAGLDKHQRGQDMQGETKREKVKPSATGGGGGAGKSA